MIFQPIGDKARWFTIHALLQGKKVGEILTYEEMAEALELDPNSDKDRHIIQVSMGRAKRELREVDKHSVTPVPGVGYRVVEVAERLELAKNHQRRATTQLTFAQSEVLNVDLTNESPAVIKLFQLAAWALSEQIAKNHQTDIGQKKLEEAMEAVQKKSTKTADEVAEILARLKRLEEQGK